MNDDQKITPRWIYGILALCALSLTFATTYRLVWHVEQEWIQIDARSVPKLQDDTVIPRVFNRKTGELCEYRGSGAKTDFTSQIARGPWICFPGPGL